MSICSPSNDPRRRMGVLGDDAGLSFKWSLAVLVAIAVCCASCFICPRTQSGDDKSGSCGNQGTCFLCGVPGAERRSTEIFLAIFNEPATLRRNDRAVSERQEHTPMHVAKSLRDDIVSAAGLHLGLLSSQKVAVQVLLRCADD